MSAPAASAVLVLVERHLAVPSVVWRFRRFRADRVYGRLTMLGVAAGRLAADRRLPYLAVAGLLFTGCALAGGLLAAAAAHAAHNLAVTRGATTARWHPDQARVAGRPLSVRDSYSCVAPARGHPRRSRWPPPRPGR